MNKRLEYYEGYLKTLDRNELLEELNAVRLLGIDIEEQIEDARLILNQANSKYKAALVEMADFHERFCTLEEFLYKNNRLWKS